MKRALVLGAGGFIGTHLVNRLKDEKYVVTGIDLKHPQFSSTTADEFIIGDLREESVCRDALQKGYDEVYQLAADMGGAGYLFTGDHDFNVMHNSAQINLNVCKWAIQTRTPKLFYSSSACIYPKHNQEDPLKPECSESSAYPADPDSEYGWEKLFSERLYLSAIRNYGLNACIARFHNVYGELSPWAGGKEKAPAAVCRKVVEATDGGAIELWGTGEQTRSFLYIDDCIEGVRMLMNTEHTGPYNIGSEEMISINRLAEMVIGFSGKKLSVAHIEGPVGVKGRNSDNRLVTADTGWKPRHTLAEGMKKNYNWIQQQVKALQSQSLNA